MTRDQAARIRRRVGQGLPISPTDASVLLDEIDRLEGWGQNTMDGCVGLLARARDAIEGVLNAVGSGRGASELLEELDEAVRQLSVGGKGIHP